MRNEVIRFSDTNIGWLYFGDNGKAQKWLITDKNGDRYYAGSDGKLVRNEVIPFSDSKIGWLYFGDNGKAQKWLITTKNGDRYYAGSDGKLVRNEVIRFSDSKIGWLYFGDNGKAQKWLITAKNGDRYYAGADGKLVRNEVIRFSDSKIGWLYFGDNGKAQKWLITAKNGDRYYAGSDGKLVRNEVIPFSDSKIGWLYFGDNGKAQKYLITAKNGDRYYGGSDGKLVRNEMIRFSDSKIGWLYFGDNGKAAVGKIVSSGGKYYYATRGDGSIMQTSGRIFLNGNMYFAQDGGVLLRNTWKKIDNKWYHFNSSGVNDKTSTTPPLDAMGEKAQKYSSSTEYLILVDRDEHRVSIYTGEIWNWRQVKTFLCGNGKASTPTITGQFSIPSKYPRSHPYFDSGSARCWYPTRIYGGYLFHSVLYYQQSGPYSIMDGRLGVGVSHGCIRLALDNAKWIYDNIPLGTKVVIY